MRGHERLILVVLHDGAERVGGDRRVEAVCTEERERVRPVDRLGDARNLRQVELSQPLDRLGDVARERLADVRRAGAHDRDLAIEIAGGRSSDTGIAA